MIKCSTKMTESDIRRAMAESGRSNVRDLMKVMKNQYTDKYDEKLARKVANDLVSEMPNY